MEKGLESGWRRSDAIENGSESDAAWLCYGALVKTLEELMRQR